jgi:hypothetical protein
MPELKGEGFSISFNPDSRDGMFGDSDGGPETALKFHDVLCGKDGHTWTGTRFFILKGDFMEDYKALIEAGESKWGLKAFYDDNRKAHGSRWSSDFHEWGKDGKRRRLKLVKATRS